MGLFSMQAIQNGILIFENFAPTWLVRSDVMLLGKELGLLTASYFRLRLILLCTTTTITKCSILTLVKDD